MCVTVRNTPTGARLACSSGSVSDEDEYIPLVIGRVLTDKDHLAISDLFIGFDSKKPAGSLVQRMNYEK